MTLFRNGADTYVAQNKPTKNFGTVPKLIVSDNTGDPANQRFAYVYFARPVKKGQSVSSATLRLWSQNEFPGAVTISIRRVIEKFAVNKVVWDTRPEVEATKIASVTKTNAPAKTLWEFDVTDLVQDLAVGGDWFGVRVGATGPEGKWFYSIQGADDFRPTLEVIVSDAPEAPTELYPRNNMAVSVAKPTLRWLFSDPAGDQTLQAIQVKLYNTKADADADTNAIGDSGQVATTLSTYDLDDMAGYAGLNVGSYVWWKAKHWDGAGLASEWSEPEQFRRANKSAAAWTSPSSGSPVVNDPTPVFAWTFPGQKAIDFSLYDPENLAEPLWTSGTVDSEDHFLTPPGKIIKESGKVYRAVLKLYDGEIRADLPDDPPYVELSLDFTYELSASVAPPSSITTAKNVAVDVWVDITWTRANAPDDFIIYQDDVELHRGASTDFIVSAGTYRYTDRLVKPRRNTKYTVVAVENGVASAENPSSTIKVIPRTTILSTIDGSKALSIWDPVRSALLTEISEPHRLLADAAPVLIVQSLNGMYEGTVSGKLVEDFGMDITVQREYIEWFRKNTGKEFRLLYVDRAMKIVAYDITFEPVSQANGNVDYQVDFAFFEIDD